MKRLFNIDSVLLIIGIIALITVLAFLSLPRVGAQDATATPPITSPNGDSLPATPESPSGAIAAYTFFLGSGLVTLLVALEKKFVPESVSAETLKQWTAVVVTALFLVLVYSGNVSWFSKGADVLSNILPYVTGFVGVLFGSSAFHQLSVKTGIPLLGFKRG